MRSSARGLIIISGMARGCDTAAHRGVHQSKSPHSGRVWDRLGCDLSRENRKIAMASWNEMER